MEKEEINSSFRSILDKLGHGKDELNSVIEFLKESRIKPSLVWTDSHKFMHKKGILYLLMNSYTFYDNKITGHDFQKYIATLANAHLKDWLKRNNHDDNLHLRLRNKHSFPSIFAIYHDKTELIQIDIVNKWYGIREKSFLNKDELESKFKKYDVEYQEKIEKQEEKINHAVFTLNHPLKVFKGVKNYIAYILINKKKLNKILNSEIDKEKHQLENLIKNHEFALSRRNEIYIKHKLMNESSAVLEPFFNEMGFKENKNKLDLY